MTVTQRHQPAALQQLVGQPRRVADPGGQHRDRNPQAEHAEPLQQLGAGCRVHGQRAVGPDEAVHAQHGLAELGLIGAGELLQRDELTLP